MTLKTKCRKHWERLGINDLENLKQYITAIFERLNHQEEVLVELYKLVFPEWNRIAKITLNPEAGVDLWKFICRRFQEFDRRHHPDCLPGGVWINKGFSINYDISPWEISYQNCFLEYNH